MENLNEHTTSELLTMLLDGELEGYSEAEIFNALANDPELQQQMQSQIAVKEIVKNDNEAFTPPIEATTGVFSKLGYPVPAGIPMLTNVWNTIFNRKVVTTALLLLVGALTVTGIVSMNRNNDNKVVANQQNSQKSINSEIIAVNDVETSSSNNAVNTIPVSKSNSIDETNDQNSLVSTDSEDSKSIEIKSDNVNNADNPDRNTNFLSIMLNSTNNIDVANTLNRNDNNKFDILRSGIKAPKYNSLNSKESSSNSLYLRAIVSSNSLPKQGGFNNLVIGYLRNWKQDLSFGAEFGKEPISRLFTDDLSNSLVTESKDVYWGAITLRYEASVIDFAGIRPFAQARFGFGSDFNYMLGMTSGLVWKSNSLPVSISAAYDLNNFTYTHLNNSYNFTKNGFNIGFHYDF